MSTREFPRHCAAVIEDCTAPEQWDAYLDSQPAATFYQRYGWKRVNEECFGHETHYLIARRDGAMVGALPLVFLKSPLFGKILCSLPFVNYGGPCGDDATVEALLVEEACRTVTRERMDYLELRTDRPVPGQLPTRQHKVSMVLGLERDPDVLWRAYDTKHRTAIRRAYKNDLRALAGGGELLDDFYRVMVSSWRALGTPLYRKGYFASILREFPSQTGIFVVYRDNLPVAAALNGYYKGVVEGMWAGVDWDFRKYQPTTVLYWEMIKHACENGQRIYHFGRSTADSGGEFFKSKWNAEPRQLYWTYFLGRRKVLPRLDVGNPRYQILMRMWRRLPPALTSAIGPPLARFLP
ncbi:MAG TPA: FemAB family XrtA/PEP-CTERM system-associated protein [Candidatus Methanoperedens sp.]|nr:FemAB family XrtA/PEP-CTERM system-associated protein [Candidatus Methanoperedens sp.]